LKRDPDAADQLLGELKGQTQTAIADIRRLGEPAAPQPVVELFLYPEDDAGGE